MIRELVSLLIFVTSASAETVPDLAGRSERLSSLIRRSLSEKFPDAVIELPSLQRLSTEKAIADFSEIQGVRLTEDKPNGTAQFEISGLDQDQKLKTELIQTPYSAWKKVPTAMRRIYPNTKLRNEDFKIIEVNVATGLPREYRGVLIPADTNFNGLQSKQTLLENQFVIVNAVEKQPDLRKGDQVRLVLVSGDLALSTPATAEEPASVGEKIRVITQKGKKELVGKVAEDHSVEVAL